MVAADTRTTVLESAKRLFARGGYDGASVRDICAEAGVSANAIHYHFGSKLHLYEQILEEFLGARLASAERMLAPGVESMAELRTRLLMFCEETLVAMLAEPEVLAIAFAELQSGFTHGGQDVAESIRWHEQRLTDFLESARKEGLFRADVDPAIVSGTLLERVINQARFVEFHEDLWETTPRSDQYRKHWVEQVVDLCLYGAVTAESMSSRHTD